MNKTFLKTFLSCLTLLLGTPGLLKVALGNPDHELLELHSYNNSNHRPQTLRQIEVPMKLNDSSHPVSKEAFWSYRELQILANGIENTGNRKYSAFPSIVRSSDSTVLISFKVGQSHYKDTGFVGLINYNPITEKVRYKKVILRDSLNSQNTEIFRAPNGDIVIYVDRQIPISSTGKIREGLYELRSFDYGKTWIDRGDVNLIDNVRYGYSLDQVIESDTILALWMTFPELQGANGKRSVSVVKSIDNGNTWSFVKNLTDEFGEYFNECSIQKIGNEFIIIGRLDDKAAAVLFKTDKDFNLLKKENLTNKYSFIGGIGRPKLFLKDGFIYSIMRNVGNLVICKIDPATLNVIKWSELFGQPEKIEDSHYAEHYFQYKHNEEFLNIIDYAAINNGKFPQIIRLGFRWEELK